MMEAVLPHPGVALVSRGPREPTLHHSEVRPKPDFPVLQRMKLRYREERADLRPHSKSKADTRLVLRSSPGPSLSIPTMHALSEGIHGSSEEVGITEWCPRDHGQ